MDLDCAAVRSRPERLPWVLGAALLLVTSTWSTARAQEGGSAGTAPALTEAQAQSATEGPEIILVEPRSDDEINADLAVLRTLSSRSQADVSQSGVSIAEAKTYVEEAKQRLKGLESQI